MIALSGAAVSFGSQILTQ